ncbi:helix-turn-helix domain-containing protein [Streptacidiphilus cavernicola]|uniref:Multiprotein-bridging factor 1 family protein n=1 Tax=Streptacidiphilus cavernicola TaxID=3342716 RepID=A0ABV6W1Q2_9ACTN
MSASCAQALARNLTEALEASGLGLRSLGERAEVSHSTISRLLRGLVLPDIGTLGRLESVLGTPLWPVWGSEAMPNVAHGTVRDLGLTRFS